MSILPRQICPAMISPTKGLEEGELGPSSSGKDYEPPQSEANQPPPKSLLLQTQKRIKICA